MTSSLVQSAPRSECRDHDITCLYKSSTMNFLPNFDLEFIFLSQSQFSDRLKPSSPDSLVLRPLIAFGVTQHLSKDYFSLCCEKFVYVFEVIDKQKVVDFLEQTANATAVCCSSSTDIFFIKNENIIKLLLPSIESEVDQIANGFPNITKIENDFGFNICLKTVLTFFYYRHFFPKARVYFASKATAKNQCLKLNFEADLNSENNNTVDMLDETDFVFIKDIGQGAQGNVSLRMSKKTGEFFAVKTFATKHNFLRERKVYRNIKNSSNSILHYFGYFKPMSIVVSFLPNGSLRSYLSKSENTRKENIPRNNLKHEIPQKDDNNNIKESEKQNNDCNDNDKNKVNEKSDKDSNKNSVNGVNNSCETNSKNSLYNVCGLSATRKTLIVLQILLAIDKLHSLGIIHRDIKIDNVLLDADNNAFLCDFESSKIITASTIGKNTVDVGTLIYMAPEQINNTGVSFQTDLYSLGILIYELSTGHNPFLDLPMSEIIDKVCAGDMPVMSRKDYGRIQKLYEKCCSKRIEDRVGSFYLINNFVISKSYFKNANEKTIEAFIEKNVAKYILKDNFSYCDYFKHIQILNNDANIDSTNEISKDNNNSKENELKANINSKENDKSNVESNGSADQSNESDNSAQLNNRTARYFPTRKFYPNKKRTITPKKNPIQRASSMPEFGRKDISMLIKVADRGNMIAQFYLGIVLDNGFGIARDEEKAFEFYLKSASQGFAKAQHNVGCCYANGIGVDHIDKEKAFEFYQKAAQQGLPESQYLVGECLLDGIGTLKDEKKGFSFLLMVANSSGMKGDTNADFRVAQCYEKGIGTEVNIEKSLFYYKRAAKNNDPEAQLKIGKYLFLNRRMFADIIDPLLIDNISECSCANIVSNKNNSNVKTNNSNPINNNTSFTNNILSNVKKCKSNDYKENIICYNKSKIKENNFCLNSSLLRCETFEKSFKYMMKSATQHQNHEAEFFLSVFYERGIGTPVDLQKSLEFCARCVKRSITNTSTSHNISNANINNSDTNSKNVNNNNSGSGNSFGINGGIAATFYATKLEFGMGVRRDVYKAFRLYTQQGCQNGVSLLHIGGYFEHGKFLNVDRGKAIECYKKSAENYQNCLAFIRLGAIEEFRNKNFQRAAHYYRKGFECDNNFSFLNTHGNISILNGNNLKNQQQKQLQFENNHKKNNKDNNNNNALSNPRDNLMALFHLARVQKDNKVMKFLADFQINGEFMLPCAMTEYAKYLADVKNDKDEAKTYLKRAIECGVSIETISNYFNECFLSDLRSSTNLLTHPNLIINSNSTLSLKKCDDSSQKIECTFKKSPYFSVKQHLFECFTCAQTNPNFVCAHCAGGCHRGHCIIDNGFIGYSICDCVNCHKEK